MKLKSKRITALVLVSVMIFSSFSMSWAVTTSGSDLYDSIYAKFSTLFETNKKANALKAIIVAETLNDGDALQSKVETNFNASAVTELNTYGFTAANILAVINEFKSKIPTSLSDTSEDSLLFLDLYKDSNLVNRYFYYEEDLEILRNEIYAKLPTEFKAKVSASEFSLILNAIIEEKIGTWNAETSTKELSLKSATKDIINTEMTNINASEAEALTTVTFELANIVLKSIDDVVKTDLEIYADMFELLKSGDFITYTAKSISGGGSTGGGAVIPPPSSTSELDAVDEKAKEELVKLLPEDSKTVTVKEQSQIVEKAAEIIKSVGLDVVSDKNADLQVTELNATIVTVVKALNAEEATKVVKDLLLIADLALDNSNVDVVEAQTMVTELIETTFSELVNKEDLVDSQVRATLENITKLVEKVINQAGTLEVNKGLTSDAIVSYDITASDLKTTIDKSVQVNFDLLKSLRANGLSTLVTAVEATINLSLPETDEEEVSLSLDAKSVASLSDKNLGLVVEVKGVSYKLPADLLGSLSAGFSIESKPVAELDLGEKTIGGKVEELKSMDLSVSDGVDTVKGEVELSFTLADLQGIDLDALMVGVYEDGVWTKISYEIKDGKVVFTAPHFSIYSLMKYESSFEDITDNWAKKYIVSLAAKGIVSGRDDLTFDPQNTITRAEFATILVNHLGLDNKVTTNYKDVLEGTWYYDIVARAGMNSITAGTINGNFRPNENITREEMAVMLFKAYKVKFGFDMVSNPYTFADQAAISDYALEAVSAAKENGIISGYPDYTFRPSATATRAEAATMMYLFLEK